MTEFAVALAGNPNSGKTTLFNDLTGAHQRVGNWPGVTVERKSGELQLGGHQIQVVDLPGIYSLEQEYMGVDEQIARTFLETGDVDLVLNIVDAHNLKRNLVLTQQILERDLPVIVVLNMIDVAQAHGMEVDTEALSSRLGVPVVPVVASRGEGIDALCQALVNLLTESPDRVGNPKDEEGVSTGERLVRRYHKSEQLTNDVVSVTPVASSLTETIDSWVLNRWLGIPFFLLMMYLMFTFAINLGAVFIDFFDILFGAVLVDGTRWVMSSLGMPEWSQVLIADGLGGGIQLVATFIPVIGFLFLCLSILEDSGYMSRAAFVVDRLMSRMGLPGTAFVPLIVGFGCNVPSVMAARTLGRASDRLMIVAMAPFMSCGARLTVYALFAAAFFPSNGQNIVFLLYLLGIAIAVLTGFLFRQRIFSSGASPSFQEMPVYHIPVLRNILLTTWFRLREFLFRAGKTIVAVFVVLSFANSIGTDGSFGNEDSEESVLSVIGKSITPVFEPIGISEQNWAATVGLFTGIFAKEAVVGTLDALYSGPESDSASSPDLVSSASAAFRSVGENVMAMTDSLTDPLGIRIDEAAGREAAAQSQGVQETTLTNMASLFGSQLAAFSYLVFVLLYTPCMAVLGTMVRESGWRWTTLVIVWSTGLAYIAACLTFQVGSFGQHPLSSSLYILTCLAAFAGLVALLRSVGRKSVSDDLIPVMQVS